MFGDPSPGHKLEGAACSLGSRQDQLEPAGVGAGLHNHPEAVELHTAVGPVEADLVVRPTS
jgi:hypothetical protein